MLFFLISTSAFATSVTPPFPSWSDLAAVNGGYTVSSGASEAVVSRVSTGTLVTNTGRLIPLAANFTAQIPRATLAQAAAKIIKKAGPAGLLAWGLYELFSPMFGLNSDGTVAPVSVTGNADAYYWVNADGNYPRSTSEQTAVARCAAYSSPQYSGVWYPGTQGHQTSDYSSFPCIWSGRSDISFGDSANRQLCQFGNYFNQTVNVCMPRPTCTSGQIWNGQSCVSSSGVPVSESDLKDKIAQSPATPAEIFDKSLQDTVREGIKNKDVGLIPSTVPASVTASPVASPVETVKTTTSPNPDGTTTTTTEQEQVTATPTSRGSTAGDSAVDWNVETSRTTTARNNTSGEAKVTTEVTNAGTSVTTKPASDLCLDHPEILACSQLGDIPTDTPTPVTSQPLNVTFTPPASVAGACPAPITKTLSGGFQVVQSFTPVCDFAGMMRPVVIAAAFLGAAFIVSGSVRVDL